MTYTERTYVRTREEAEAAKQKLDDRYGGFPHQGKTFISECTLQDRDTKETYPGFEVECRYFGSN
jgi:hypothetical protein